MPERRRASASLVSSSKGYGPPNPRWADLKDARTFKARLPFVGLILVLTFTGMIPGTMVDTIKSGVSKIRIPALQKTLAKEAT